MTNLFQLEQRKMLLCKAPRLILWLQFLFKWLPEFHVSNQRSREDLCDVCTTPFRKNKKRLLGCWLIFSSTCVCLHVRAHTHRGLWGAECASVFSSIFNIFKILNENVAVNFKLIWMDSNKMQTSLQIRIFSEDF